MVVRRPDEGRRKSLHEGSTGPITVASFGGAYSPRRTVSTETKQLRRRYYNARVCAHTQVHSLFFHSHNPMEWLAEATGDQAKDRRF